MLNHNKLKCYEMALGIAKRMPQIIRSWPSGNGYLIDQLKRALSSVILNIAEGNGRFSVKDRKRFFNIAIASAYEVSAVFDIAESYRMMNESDYQQLQDMLLQTVKMLYKLS